MALSVSGDAQQIDENLRSRAANDAKRFAHMAEKAASRKHTPAPKQKATASGWSEKIAKMRETYPKAYMSWEDADDALLKQEFNNGVELKDLSKKLGRHEGSIKMRLQKHYGEDMIL